MTVKKSDDKSAAQKAADLLTEHQKQTYHEASGGAYSTAGKVESDNDTPSNH